jgi:hypothetical protein
MHLASMVLSWSKYKYLRLHMGLCNSPDMFQEKVSEFIVDLKFGRAYLNDHLEVPKEIEKQRLKKSFLL